MPIPREPVLAHDLSDRACPPKNNLVPLVPRSGILAINFSFCLFSGIEKTGHQGAPGEPKRCWAVFPFLLWPRTFPLTKMTTHASNTGKLSSARDKALLYDTAPNGFRGMKTVLDWF